MLCAQIVCVYVRGETLKAVSISAAVVHSIGRLATSERRQQTKDRLMAINHFRVTRHCALPREAVSHFRAHSLDSPVCMSSTGDLSTSRQSAAPRTTDPAREKSRGPEPIIEHTIDSSSRVLSCTDNNWRGDGVWRQ